MSSKQSETRRRGVGTNIGGGKWTISNTTKGTTGCNCALFQSTCKTPISGKHCLRRASGKIQTPGAFTGTASSTTWQMEKMRRAFSPLYESLLAPPALGEGCHGGLSGRLRHAKCAAAWVQHTSSARHRNGCGMHPRWRGRGNRIEYTIARPRGSVRGGAGCVVHGGTRQILGRHCESLPAEVRVRGKSRS